MLNILLKPLPLAIISVAVLVSGCNQTTRPSDKAEAGELSSHRSDINKAPVSPMVKALPTGASQLAYMPVSLSRKKASINGVSYTPPAVDNNQYDKMDTNGVISVSQQPRSTFSIDVDTGAWSQIRKTLNRGYLPPTDLVRTEEMINYFAYDYPQPKSNGVPFSVYTEVGMTPWNPNTRLVHIGIQAKATPAEKRPATNLVFLMDVSGSMSTEDKLPLLKTAFKLLLNQLTEKDSVAIVVYAGASGVVLEPTAGNKKAAILEALNELSAGGSTHGSAGIELAYKLAEQAKIEGGINRIMLATDGDFNVGTVDHDALMDLIKKKRQSGITLTTLGFGSGNYNDYLMEQLADQGNGNYAYIDTISEAQKVLVDELSATLETIAKDVKIQIEWNPDVVSEYRLIGYENRVLKDEDFNNDKVDAGDIGAGHTVTALYEITLVGSKKQQIEPYHYQQNQHKKIPSDGRFIGHNNASELAFLKLRYKEPQGKQSKLISRVIKKDRRDTNSNNFNFSAAVAGFAELLRGGKYSQSWNYDSLMKLAQQSKGDDPYGYRGEFVRLVNLSKSLDNK